MEHFNKAELDKIDKIDLKMIDTRLVSTNSKSQPQVVQWKSSARS